MKIGEMGEKIRNGREKVPKTVKKGLNRGKVCSGKNMPFRGGG